MASRLEQDLSCPICHELFRDPVVLCCSHSFCKDCLQTWWQHSPIKTCPFCKRRCKRYPNGPPQNLALKNAAETYAKQRVQTTPEQPKCSLHSEKLQLFCVDHQEPVCLVCRDSNIHTDHSFRPIEEAAPDLREQLKSSMQPLQDKLKSLNKWRNLFESAAAQITAHGRRTQTQIRAQFEKLHQFLREEEESRMMAIREEEEHKTLKIKTKMAAVSRDIEAVSKTIADTEEQLRAADTSFLLQYKAAVERVQRCSLVEEPKMKREAMIDQAEHLGNLCFNVWRSMQKLVQFYPVVLDPHSSGPRIVLSEDLSSVRAPIRQRLPQFNGKYDKFGVGGYERFSSGIHSWEVEVGGNKDWAVGVIGYVQRGEETVRGVWWLCFTDDEYSTVSFRGPGEPLSVKSFERVRVKMDFDTNTVTFTDPDTNTDLFTATDTFVNEVAPYLRTTDNIPLKILPKETRCSCVHSAAYDRGLSQPKKSLGDQNPEQELAD